MYDEQPDFSLLIQFIEGNTSPEETEKVLGWIKECKRNEELYFRIKDVVDFYRSKKNAPANLDGKWKEIVSRVNKEKQPSPVIKWKRLAIAASVLLLFSTGLFFYFSRQSSKGTELPVLATSPSNDIVPGADNAILTLANGSKITLDSIDNGTLARQGSMNVSKLDGQLTYYGELNASSSSLNSEVLYNTLSTGKGNQYRLTLSDGTRVWLNAVSSIRFPASFIGNERRVEITGEAYFEVVKNAAMPFRVSANGTEVEVLGTHFNVNAYTDEEQTRTTLVEGLVKVRNEKAVQMLSPGQQAGTQGNGKITLTKNVDVAEVTAWKDGYFLFNNTGIHDLMRQVSRWYDVEVSFEGKVESDGFSGRIPRNVMLSKLLKILELNDVHFRVEGRKLIVVP